jgi:hypothetical protein
MFGLLERRIRIGKGNDAQDQIGAIFRGANGRSVSAAWVQMQLFRRYSIKVNLQRLIDPAIIFAGNEELRCRNSFEQPVVNRPFPLALFALSVNLLST